MTRKIGKPDPVIAEMFAMVAHKEPYDTDIPYLYHLRMVVEVLKEFGFSDPVMLCAGFCHDMIEDTTKSYNDIVARLGVEVAELVFAVTDDKGRNREERHARVYKELRGKTEATALKLADRIANVKYGIANGSGMTAKYAKEYADFEAVVREPNGEDERVTRMWTTLGKLMRES